MYMTYASSFLFIVSCHRRPLAVHDRLRGFLLGFAAAFASPSGPPSSAPFASVPASSSSPAAAATAGDVGFASGSAAFGSWRDWAGREGDLDLATAGLRRDRRGFFSSASGSAAGDDVFAAASASASSSACTILCGPAIASSTGDGLGAGGGAGAAAFRSAPPSSLARCASSWPFTITPCLAIRGMMRCGEDERTSGAGDLHIYGDAPHATSYATAPSVNCDFSWYDPSVAFDSIDSVLQFFGPSASPNRMRNWPWFPKYIAAVSVLNCTPS